MLAARPSSNGINTLAALLQTDMKNTHGIEFSIAFYLNTFEHLRSPFLFSSTTFFIFLT